MDATWIEQWDKPCRCTKNDYALIREEFEGDWFVYPSDKIVNGGSLFNTKQRFTTLAAAKQFVESLIPAINMQLAQPDFRPVILAPEPPSVPEVTAPNRDELYGRDTFVVGVDGTLEQYLEWKRRKDMAT